MTDQCSVCKKEFNYSELYEYRGAIACENCFDKAIKGGSENGIKRNASKIIRYYSRLGCSIYHDCSCFLVWISSVKMVDNTSL